MRLQKISFVLFTFFSIKLFAIDIELTNGETYFSVTEKSVEEFTFINSVSKIETNILKTESQEFLNLIIPSYGSNSEDGTAELPVLQKLIRVPQGSQIEIKILNLEEILIDLMDYGFNLDVFPNQASILKSSNPDNIPFCYNEDYYNIDKFSGNNFVSTELLGTMRGQNLARLSISPVSYNPVTNQIKVITKAEVKVIFKGKDDSIWSQLNPMIFLN